MKEQQQVYESSVQSDLKPLLTKTVPVNLLTLDVVKILFVSFKRAGVVE